MGVPNLAENDRFSGYREDVLSCVERALVGVEHVVIVTPSTDKPGISGIVDRSNLLIKKALEEGFSHLWIVQADVCVPEGSFRNLLGLSVDVALGVVPRHDDKTAFICGFMDERQKVWYLPRQAVQGQVLSGWVFASGCILVRRRVLEAGISFRYVPNIGEDILFMFDVQKAGFVAKVDGRVVCGHLPEWPLNSVSASMAPSYSLLDVGCGHRPKGDVNLDLFTEATAHRVADQRVNDDVALRVHEISNFVKGDACNLPFRDNAFKASYSWHVIEHLADPEGFLSELMRVSSDVEVRCPNGEYLNCRDETKPLHLHNFSLSWFRETLSAYPDWDFSFTWDYSQSEPWEIVVHGTRK